MLESKVQDPEAKIATYVGSKKDMQTWDITVSHIHDQWKFMQMEGMSFIPSRYE